MLKLNRPTLLKHFIRACLLCNLVFFCLLIAFTLIPLTFSENQIVTVTRQGARSQRIAKDVLELRYVPKSKDEAVGELQSMLPSWESDEATLTKNLSPEALTLLNNTNLDFSILDSSTKKLLINPDLVTDPIQLQLIVDHEWPYYHAIQQIIIVLTSQLATLRLQVAVIGISIYVLLIAMNVSAFVGLERLGKGSVTRQQLTVPLSEAAQHLKEREETT
jgi:hypothetical protein